jgi:hypothetical protein
VLISHGTAFGAETAVRLDGFSGPDLGYPEGPHQDFKPADLPISPACLRLLSSASRIPF